MDFKGQYLAYEEYRGLGGTLNLMPFNLLEYEARKQIDKFTFGRLKDLEEQIQEVKLCVYDLIKTISSYSDLEGLNKTIASESTDGYSISYRSTTKETTDAKNSEIEDVIHTYLSDCKLSDGTPYLYRGADVN